MATDSKKNETGLSRRSLLVAGTVGGALLSSTGTSLAAGKTNATVRVLFLGDQAGHKPAQRFELLQPVMAARNIEMTYTESLEDLNPKRLAQFDCLKINAKHTRIAPEQERA